MELSGLSEKYINFPINFIDVATTILVAFLLSLVVKFVYNFRHSDNASDWRLQDQFYLLGPIVSVIMLFIGSNLALSIGLVGSLSIIRFRSAIKSPMDLIYLLWVISIGLGCGTQNYLHISAATFLLCLIVLFKKLIIPTEQKTTFNLLRISGDSNHSKVAEEFIMSHFASPQLLSIDFIGDNFEAAFRINDNGGISQKILELKNKNDLQEVSLINNESFFSK